MEVKGRNYRVTYDPRSARVVFQGALRLRGMDEYAPIAQLMNAVVTAAPAMVTLDLRGLRFLNSPGINMLFHFIINMRDRARGQVVVLGSARIPWQAKSLDNMRRLVPGLRLEFR
jgi:hypothetical protein